MDLTQTPWIKIDRSEARYVDHWTDYRWPPSMADEAYAADIRRRTITLEDGEWTWRGRFGCSDEYLAAHPDYGRDPDGPDVMGRLGWQLSRCCYPEGERVRVRAVAYEAGGVVIADRTWTVIGAGRGLNSLQAAERAGVTPSTWRAYVARGQAPSADYPDEAWGALSRPTGGHWRESTIDRWKTNRPGQGARTDLNEASDS